MNKSLSLTHQLTRNAFGTVMIIIILLATLEVGGATPTESWLTENRIYFTNIHSVYTDDLLNEICNGEFESDGSRLQYIFFSSDEGLFLHLAYDEKIREKAYTKYNISGQCYSALLDGPVNGFKVIQIQIYGVEFKNWITRAGDNLENHNFQTASELASKQILEKISGELGIKIIK